MQLLATEKCELHELCILVHYNVQNVTVQRALYYAISTTLPGIYIEIMRKSSGHVTPTLMWPQIWASCPFGLSPNQKAC